MSISPEGGAVPRQAYHSVKNQELFIEHRFLEPELCAWLREEVDHAPLKAAAVNRGDRGGRTTDVKSRKTKRADVSAEAMAEMGGRLDTLMPRLVGHFGPPLTEYQPPHFLRYDEGHFFGPHEDTGPEPDLPEKIRLRRVSAVVFLNAHDDYDGGVLRFLDPRIEIRGEEGLLVAFPATRRHEVTAVTRGRRYSLVSWFTASEGASAV
ncbi:prolyl hydroxylase family protein [Streptosporangium sandarakinum]|uniref:prolyl hydroxylase family protein n=1 Tax=Streptosporangium sandarakinum TaxID=1260955 RepID=UPI00343DEAAC